MKHNRTRVLRWSMERTRWVRSIRAWRNLLPDWTPTLDEQVALETMPHEHRAAVAVITEGWEPNDPRWDVFMALLEWERREERRKHVTVLPEEFWDGLAQTAEADERRNADRCRDAAEEVLSRMGQEWDQAEMDQFLSTARQRLHMPQGVDVCSLCGGAGHAAENCPGTDPPPALRQAIIPVKVVTSQGQTLSETTLETPIKAAFLDRLTPVKHLREKQGDA